MKVSIATRRMIVLLSPLIPANRDQVAILHRRVRCEFGEIAGKARLLAVLASAVTTAVSAAVSLPLPPPPVGGIVMSSDGRRGSLVRVFAEVAQCAVFTLADTRLASSGTTSTPMRHETTARVIRATEVLRAIAAAERRTAFKTSRPHSSAGEHILQLARRSRGFHARGSEAQPR